MRDLGADEIVGWSFTDPGVADSLRLPDDDPRRDLIELGNPLSGEQSAMRTTLLGSLLDAARLNLARGAERVTLFESGRVYLREALRRGETGRRVRGRSPARRWTSRTGSGCLAAGPPAAAGAARARPPTSSRVKGLLESLCAQLGAELGRGAGARSRSWIPGAAAAISLGGRPAGWIGEIHPLVAARLGPRRRRRLRARPRRAGRVGDDGNRELRGRHHLPARSRGHRCRDRRGRARAAGSRGGPGRRRRAARAPPRSSTSTRASRWARAARAWRCASTFRAPDRTLTDEEVAERRAAITRGAGEDRRELRE